MVQIINKRNPYGELGSALGSGLQSLAAHKIGQIQQQQQQQRTATGLQQLLNISPEQAHAYSNLDPAILKEVVQYKLAEPSQQAYAQGIAQILGQGAPEYAREQYQPQEISQEEIAAKPRNIFEYTPEQIAQEKRLTPTAEQVSKFGISPNARLTEKQATELGKLALKKEALSKQEKSEAFKETKDIRKEITTKAKNARQNLHDLERMEELDKEGKLDTPGYAEFLKRSGFDIPALMNPESEEFNKIAANFVRGVKETFGGKISNFEVEQFLKTIPSLSQSPEGRKRVIANLKHLYRADLEYKNTAKEIIAENRGIPPLDLADQIDDRIGKKLDKLSDQFKKDLARPVPKGQNKFITALQAGAGSAVSSIPGALKGAAKGAVAGAAFGKLGGGPGTITGAGLGALGGLFGLI